MTNHSAPKTDRDGYSLIEMLLVVTITGIVSSLAIGMMLMVMRVDRLMGQSGQQLQAMQTLGMRFRDDIHTTVIENIITNADSGELVLHKAPDELITYRFQENGIVRTTSPGGDIEQFVIEPLSEGAFEMDAQQNVITLRFENLSTGQRADLARPELGHVEIWAVPGLHITQEGT